MNRLILIVMLTVLAPVQLISAQDLEPLNYKSKDARDALRSYSRAGQEASEAFENAREKATEKLIEELNDVFEKEKSRGNLDEALKLRTTLEQLEKYTPQTATGIESAIIGKWTIQFPEYTHKLEILRQGAKLNYVLEHGPDHSRKETGEVVIKDGYFALGLGRKSVSRCHLHGGRLYVEFWVNGGDAGSSKHPDHLAIGTKGR